MATESVDDESRNEFGGRFTGVKSKLQSDIYDAAHSINGSNVLIDYDKLEAIITRECARKVLEGRVEEVQGMPHQYDPDAHMHVMSDDPIPLPTVCNCYKGKRLDELRAAIQEMEGK